MVGKPPCSRMIWLITGIFLQVLGGKLHASKLQKQIGYFLLQQPAFVLCVPQV